MGAIATASPIITAARRQPDADILAMLFDAILFDILDLLSPLRAYADTGACGVRAR